jgi:hypothetical protein
MKNTFMSVIIAALAAATLVGCNQDLAEFTESTAAPVGIAPDTLIDYGHWGALYPHQYNLQKALVYAIQDEHLAQGEYQYINRKFGSPPAFRGIVNAEGCHIRALTNLFVQRGWPVPPNQSAQYIIPVNTLREAYLVGVSAEETNIAMYNLFLTRPDLPSNFRTVFTNLRDASICHLNAFRRHTDN